ncbi:MAG: 4-diphosphocytidyl-2-C-methyl-D-erythritol kinase [Thermoleophilia bacterium]|nr:4-diphosphocytidyl-2-C-methyl-D-erythritol kinase [Thermoleophilia bacterium]
MSTHSIGFGLPEQDGTLRATRLAPAKINLLLAVGSRRDDGFHELATVMQTLDLGDRIDVDVDLWDSEVIDVLVEAPGVPGGDTLVTRAVEELLRRIGRGVRVWITVEKEVPVGGGLGGGSSDAATALRAVHELLGSPLPEAELVEIAASLGSDVPFFLLGPGSTAYATGRGECIERIDDLPPKAWLLAFPNEHQSTADVYGAFDPTGREPLPLDADAARRLARRAPRRNDLTDAARAACTGVDRLMRAFADAGGEPIVCGSGATVAVPLTSQQDRVAFEGVATTAVPGCWLRVAWTTAAHSDA